MAGRRSHVPLIDRNRRDAFAERGRKAGNAILRVVAALAVVAVLVWVAPASWWQVKRGPGDISASTRDDPASASAVKLPMGAAEAQAERPAETPPGRLVIPVAGMAATDLVDTFTQARDGGARRHDAIDIMAARGTRVVAAARGRVESLFRSDDGGKTVYVRSADRRRIYYYAHLDRYAPGLREGMTVRRGQPLGTVGSTGNANADAPHLHFEIMRVGPGERWYEGGTAINPYPVLTGSD